MPQQPVFIASEKVQEQLIHCERTPPNLLGELSVDDIRDLVRDSLKISSRYWAINSEIFSADSRENLSDSFFQRFLSMLSGRAVVYLDVVKAGELSEAIKKYHRLSEIISSQHMGQDSTKYTIVVVVDGDLSDEDKKAINRLSDSVLTRIYLMEGELDTGNSNLPFVHAGNVWASAIPQLLVRLLEEPLTNITQPAQVMAWRSVVIEPNLLTAPVLTIYDRWVKNTVLSSEDKFDVLKFSPPELAPDLGPPSGPFQIDFTSAFKAKNTFAKKVTDHLEQKDMGEIRRKSAETLREDVVNASGIVNSFVRRSEISSWNQAHSSPALVRSMSKALSIELTNEESQLSSDLNSWKLLLSQLDTSDRKIRNARKAAEVLDKARSHLISWDMRLLLCCVSVLVVFYLVFVTLKPPLGLIFTEGTFWFACGLGVFGTVAAAFLSHFLEVRSGKAGALFVTDKVQEAVKFDTTKATMEYLATINEDKQRMSCINRLDNTIELSKRLRQMIDSVTRSKIDESSIALGDDEIARLDRKTHSDGTRVIIGKQDEQSNITYASSVIDRQAQEFLQTLNAAWNDLAAACDTKNRGSFPLDTVTRFWGHAIVDVWSKFRMEVIEDIVKDWRKETTLTDSFPDQIRQLQGFAVSRRPFISTKQHSNENVVRLLIARDNQLVASVEPVLNEAGDSRVIPSTSISLPYYAMIFEEMSVDFTLEEPGNV